MKLEAIRATVEMVDIIGQIGFASWNAAYSGIVPQNELQSRTPQKRADFLRGVIGTQPEECCVFSLDSRPAGYAIIGASQEAGDEAGEIHAMYFLPLAWGTGCAAEAMGFCLCRLKAMGYAKAALWVLEDNLRARRFYEKHGFGYSGSSKRIVIGRPLTEMRYEMILGG